MAEKLTSESMIRDTRELAVRAFRDHVITRRPHPRSWILQRIHADGRPEMTYATEVVALEFRGLYVGGDIEPVIFRGGPVEPMGRVFWMGETTSWDYIREKAQSGLSCNGKLVDRWESDLARAELRGYLAERAADGEPVKLDKWEFECALQADEQHEFYDHAYRAVGGGDAWEVVGGMGVTLDARVIYAHAALTKLSALLRAELAAQTGVTGA